ncbi:MAG: cytochrome c [Verrucomicrobia bacterium]|nr:cytochrome c [Verrucomicrobiota bacterium]
MRYFLLLLGLSTVLVMVVAGKRGDMSRRPPIEIFPDMDRQPKLRPQTRNNFFPDQLSSQMPVPGTIARGTPYEDTPVNTGRITGTTNFVETIPVPVTEQLITRGQQRFQINCSPCHSAMGDGNGITKRLGMAVVGNLHDKRIVELPDGDVFNTISNGKNLMGAYGANVSIQDRWAIVAYVRALQRSRLADLNDVPEAQRGALKK